LVKSERRFAHACIEIYVTINWLIILLKYWYYSLFGRKTNRQVRNLKIAMTTMTVKRFVICTVDLFRKTI